jgi:hypothetical protein
MKLYTITQLEEFTEEQITQTIDERGKLLASLINNTIVGKEICGFPNLELKQKDKISLKIDKAEYGNGKIFYDDMRIFMPLNIYLADYDNKKGRIFEDTLFETNFDELLTEIVDKKSRFRWGSKKLQGQNYINVDLLFPSPLIIPDILALQQYKAYCKKSKKVSAKYKEQIKQELEDKLSSEIEELKDRRFNLIRETHLYIPENKDELMSFIKKSQEKFDKEALKGVMLKHSDNEEIVLVVLDLFNDDLFEFASDRLKKDKKFINKCIDEHNHINIVEFIDEKFRDDKKFMTKCVNIAGYIIRAASDRLKNDKNLCLEAVADDANAYLVISEEMMKDKDVLFKAMEERGDYFAFHPEIKTNKELLIQAFSTAFDRQSRNLLERTSEELKNDEEVALAAVKCYAENFYYLGEELKAKIGNNNPLASLEKMVAYNKLNFNLPNEEKAKKPKAKI